MTWWRCSRQEEMRRAGRSGRVAAELRRHAATCGRCRDVLLVTEALSTTASGVPSTLDPALLWARARVERRLRRQARASWVRTALRVAAGIAIVGGAGGLIAMSDAAGWSDLIEIGSRVSLQPMERTGPSPTQPGVWLFSLPALVALALASLWRWVSRDA